MQKTENMMYVYLTNITETIIKDQSNIIFLSFSQGLVDIQTDGYFLLPAVMFAKYLTSASNNTNVFLYLFDHYPEVRYSVVEKPSISIRFIIIKHKTYFKTFLIIQSILLLQIS